MIGNAINTNEISNIQKENDIATISSSIENLDSLLRLCMQEKNNDKLHTYLLKLNEFITETIINCLETKDFSLLNGNIIHKLISLAEKDNPLKQVESTKMLVKILANEEVTENILQTENQKNIINLINTLLTALEKFNQLPLAFDIGNTLKEILDRILKKGQLKESHNCFKQVIDNHKLNPNRIILTPIQEKCIDTIKELIKTNDYIMKKGVLALMNKILANSHNFRGQINILCNVLNQFFNDLIKVDNWIDDEINSYFDEILNLIEKFIFQFEYQITMDRVSPQTIKIYTLKEEKDYIANTPAVLKNMALLLNPMLLRPFNINLQMRVFNIIRRLYYFYPDHRNTIVKPLNLVITNIALYGTKSNEFKEASRFVSQVLHSEEMEDLKALFEANSNLNELKENEYYDPGTINYAKDIQKIYHINDFILNIGYTNTIEIESGKIYTHSLYLENNENLVFWKLKVLNHDIKFGMFKLNSLEVNRYDIDTNQITSDPNNHHKLQQVIKIQKIQASEKYFSGSIIILDPGYYKLVFDNTHSIWRSKTVEFSVHCLEAK